MVRISGSCVCEEGSSSSSASEYTIHEVHLVDEMLEALLAEQEEAVTQRMMGRGRRGNSWLGIPVDVGVDGEEPSAAPDAAGIARSGALWIVEWFNQDSHLITDDLFAWSHSLHGAVRFGAVNLTHPSGVDLAKEAEKTLNVIAISKTVSLINCFPRVRKEGTSSQFTAPILANQRGVQEFIFNEIGGTLTFIENLADLSRFLDSDTRSPSIHCPDEVVCTFMPQESAPKQSSFYHLILFSNVTSSGKAGRVNNFEAISDADFAYYIQWMAAKQRVYEVLNVAVVETKSAEEHAAGREVLEELRRMCAQGTTMTAAEAVAGTMCLLTVNADDKNAKGHQGRDVDVTINPKDGIDGPKRYDQKADEAENGALKAADVLKGGSAKGTQEGAQPAKKAGKDKKGAAAPTQHLPATTLVNTARGGLRFPHLLLFFTTLDVIPARGDGVSAYPLVREGSGIGGSGVARPQGLGVFTEVLPLDGVAYGGDGGGEDDTLDSNAACDDLSPEEEYERL